MLRETVKRRLSRIYRSKSNSHHNRHNVSILCYHSVNDTTNIESNPISIDNFESHLRFLKDNYNVIRVVDLIEALNDKVKLPEKAVAITFDDGYVDNFENAFPLLQKYALPATFFVVTAFLDGEVDLNGFPGWEPLSWDQIRMLDASDLIDIGAHTHTHRIMSALSKEEVKQEVILSFERLRKELGHPVDVFAYPFGQGKHISRDAIDAVIKVGFGGAFSTIWRNQHHISQRFILGRLMVSSDDNLNDLRLKIAGNYNFVFYLQYLKSLIHFIVTRRGIF